MAITQGQIQDAKSKLRQAAASLETQGMTAGEAMDKAREQYPDEAQLEAVEDVLFPKVEPEPEPKPTPVPEPETEPEPKHKKSVHHEPKKK